MKKRRPILPSAASRALTVLVAFALGLVGLVGLVGVVAVAAGPAAAATAHATHGATATGHAATAEHITSSTTGHAASPQASPATTGIQVYVGYADTLRPDPTHFPTPWSGSPDVKFEGCTTSCSFDAGAVRIVNNTSITQVVNSISVSLSTCTFAMWPGNVTLDPGQQLIITQTASGASDGWTTRQGSSTPRTSGRTVRTGPATATSPASSRPSTPRSAVLRTPTSTADAGVGR